tara:strand:+ start:1658 stop:1849 length:192 start_codon:yes stop_codon:yes gene_type:complete
MNNPRDYIVELFQTEQVDPEYLIIGLAKFLSQDECQEFLRINELLPEQMNIADDADAEDHVSR